MLPWAIIQLTLENKTDEEKKIQKEKKSMVHLDMQPTLLHTKQQTQHIQ